MRWKDVRNVLYGKEKHMQAEICDWCVTLYAEDRNKETDSLVVLVRAARAKGFSVGSSGVVPLPWLDRSGREDDKECWLSLTPTVHIFHCTWRKFRHLAEESGIVVATLRIKRIMPER